MCFLSEFHNHQHALIQRKLVLELTFVILPKAVKKKPDLSGLHTTKL
ncbi:hypothetical protein B6N60_04042 [Richelia sinica FACHB-800]|uniref:Uncharacterized protein n=1 Tax=Richelia sinica FACHB-800 TaxID=1357546 RepID=A0A975TC71_9NOST|nr:hypothetical protein B6N60_04042 [Richelia sinica FACHB-800]